MRTVSVKIPERLDKALAATARRRRTTRSALIREALEALVAGGVRPQPGSVAEAAADLIGCVAGPGDLSTNPTYLEDFGK